MPIKKRSTPAATAGTPLQELIKRHDQLASDAAWEGKQSIATRHEKIAAEYRTRLENGELYLKGTK